jgi:Ca-activated chloride channel family protein
MKINLDDPNLTAFALGELPESERAAMKEAIASSPEAQQFVAETQQLARLLKSEYTADHAESIDWAPHRSPEIMMMEEQRRLWKPDWTAVAAAIAVFALIGALAISTIVRKERLTGQEYASGGKQTEQPGAVEYELGTDSASQAPAKVERDNLAVNAPPPESQMLSEFTPGEKSVDAGSFYARRKHPIPDPVQTQGDQLGFPQTKEKLENKLALGKAQPAAAAANDFPEHSEMSGRNRQDFDTAAYDHISENPFLPAATNPLSTFSIDVDTASYSNVRRFINTGSLPPKDAVRVEEMINYFSYDYREPEGDKPFSIDLDGTSCPWDESHRLVRIGLKGREVTNQNRPASNLVFLLDVSGSMSPVERLPLVKQAMRLLVEKLTEKDRVAMVIYAGGSGLALPSTTGDRKEVILSALEDLKAGGSTNGAEGIELAYKIAVDNFIKGGVNRVILATDGDFNIGVTNQGDLTRLIEEKAKSGVFLSVLGVGTDNLKDSTMQKLADKGNGNYAYLDSIDEARKVLVQQINGTLMTIAKDVKIQVEFNPARVASYRLIGYEKRILRKEDFNNDKVDAGEIGAGHTVTALYEIVPAGTDATDPASSVPAVDPLKYQAAATAQSDSKASQEMVTVKLRYKKPDGDTSQLLERAFVDNGSKFVNAAPDLKFAAAVAQFGMILRDSQYKGKGSLGAVIEWAQEGKGRDAAGYRAGFIEMARKTQALKKSEG